MMSDPSGPSEPPLPVFEYPASEPPVEAPVAPPVLLRRVAAASAGRASADPGIASRHVTQDTRTCEAHDHGIGERRSRQEGGEHASHSAESVADLPTR